MTNQKGVLPDLQIEYPEALPVTQRREEIARAIANHQVVIVAGETGSGKTTQLPKICLELGRGQNGLIGHTQPRRLAARTVAQRIAQELKGELGQLVGYQVRFTDKVSEDTAIKLMTDGILLAEIQRDRLLRRYDTIIIDEAHERSLNIDFLLGYLKQLLPQRPDLKIIITSATIDVDSFARHFDDAPVIEVSGRTYPVTTHYLDADPGEGEDVPQRIATLVQDIDAGDYGKRGDILVFLSGERDIRELAKLLRRETQLDILPLYARLSAAEQNRVFDLGSRRGLRVILATNVAETSLTVPGIRYVIDPGDARISRYSYRTKVQRLPIESISQASANQRMGRCGRVEEGVCLRLYSEQDFLSRPEFTDPEILRTNLAAVVLQMTILGLGDVEAFPFINPPDPRLVRDGYKLLEELGAVTPDRELTSVGRRMARLPVDPRLGRMVLAAGELGCMAEVLVIAAALAVQDPKERPADKQQQSDQAHARFRHEKSDFLGWLNLWRYYEEQRQALSQNQLRKLCKKEFLSFMRMREWRDIHAQLSIACRQQKIKTPAQLPEEENYQGVHRALLAGLLGNIAQHHEDREYLGARNRKLQIFPGSGLSRKRPKWIVAAEIVETSKVFARTVAAIDPLWVVDINPDLLKHHYYQPRWQSRSGRVMAWERLTLYGLTIADKRSVHYGPLAPEESRELLIREGLVAGKYRQHPPFLKHNLRLVREVEELESRTRRRDILVDEEVIFEFYNERLPDNAYTAGRLQSWLKRSPERGESLQMAREQLLARDPGGELEDQFPSSLDWQDMSFRLSYQFEPGKEADGVSVTVPVALLNRVPRFLFDWLVPGLLREKCIALVKSLPKDKRKRLVPAPDFVDRALATLEPDDSDLLQALSRTLDKMGNVQLTPADWSAGKLDDYYRMNVRVVDAQGKLLAQGRNLQALIDRFRDDTRQSVGKAKTASPARDGLTRWDFGDVPREWRFRQAGQDIVSYPALVPREKGAAIELCDYPAVARLAHREGVLHMLRLHSAQQVKYLRKQLLRGNDFNLVLAGAGLDRTALVDDLIDAAYVQAMSLDEQLPYSEADFGKQLERGKGDVISRANEIETTVLAALKPLATARTKLAASPMQRWPNIKRDIDDQVSGLLVAGFLRDTPASWLVQYPRYMKALLNRIERLSGQVAKDEKYCALLAGLTEPLQQATSQRAGFLAACPAAMQYRFMLEEYRVSLFAQHLGTRQAVSEKRLAQQWREVEQWLEANPQ
ncbi:ATP-dependent RNA helicase HrpA [Halioglobus japonicus]|uniref:ATP-dependent RNA helicase HrpA n=1 Tax=Halioglobus japonicus TaxID=930805 RepID=A0AAP8SPD6_9GAMM|nr:ATP-dependent RNA helicase HrpA [Halioglobus japonicus]AQA19375.1 ATP-dependent RNA helicase HrpA [Halioglobus japonicus]PLW87572.1 ATP-dependent RNA helicase HrpA [Halioglobus japonicus]GHD07731.1 ATP-dependent helicase [Halioglobus japonicus]